MFPDIVKWPTGRQISPGQEPLPPRKSPLPICVILFLSYFSLFTAHYLVEHLFYVYVYCLSLDREVHKCVGFVLFPTLTPVPGMVSVILAAAQ